MVTTVCQIMVAMRFDLWHTDLAYAFGEKPDLVFMLSVTLSNWVTMANISDRNWFNWSHRVISPGNWF